MLELGIILRVASSAIFQDSVDPNSNMQRRSSRNANAPAPAQHAAPQPTVDELQMKQVHSYNAARNIEGFRRLMSWLSSPLSGWKWRQQRGLLISLCMLAAMASTLSQWPFYMRLERSWKQPATRFLVDFGICMAISAAIALSPSMKNFHPLKLCGIWLIAAPLGMQFGWLGPAGVLTAGLATTAIWIGRGL